MSRLQGDEPLSHEKIRPGAYLVLTVSDTGHGMTDEVKERIFEPFFTTKPAGTGTGMGLALAYGIVKSHEGAITVSSDPEKGSLFSVYLPQLKSDVVRADEKKGPIPTGTERILFVDDEEPLVEMADDMLSALGYKVKSLTDAMKALQLVTLDPYLFDLVITDQAMPKITGRLLARRIKEIRPDLPIILCTGYSEQISKETEEAEGIAEFVMKPLTEAEDRADDQARAGRVRVVIAAFEWQSRLPRYRLEDLHTLTPAPLKNPFTYVPTVEYAKNMISIGDNRHKAVPSVRFDNCLEGVFR